MSLDKPIGYSVYSDIEQWAANQQILQAGTSKYFSLLLENSGFTIYQNICQSIFCQLIVSALECSRIE